MERSGASDDLVDRLVQRLADMENLGWHHMPHGTKEWDRYEAMGDRIVNIQEMARDNETRFAQRVYSEGA